MKKTLTIMLCAASLLFAGCTPSYVKGRSLRVNVLMADLMEKYPAYDKDRLMSVRGGTIYIGLPKELVKLAWGDPYDIDRTLTRYGAIETWQYCSDVVIFTRGRVSSIHDKDYVSYYDSMYCW